MGDCLGRNFLFFRALIFVSTFCGFVEINCHHPPCLGWKEITCSWNPSFILIMVGVKRGISSGNSSGWEVNDREGCFYALFWHSSVTVGDNNARQEPRRFLNHLMAAKRLIMIKGSVTLGIWKLLISDDVCPFPLLWVRATPVTCGRATNTLDPYSTIT